MQIVKIISHINCIYACVYMYICTYFCLRMFGLKELSILLFSPKKLWVRPLGICMHVHMYSRRQKKFSSPVRTTGRAIPFRSRSGPV